MAALREPVAPRLDIERTVREILDDVRARGDDAVRAHALRLDGVEPAPRYGVPPSALRAALAAAAPELRAALELAAANIRASTPASCRSPGVRGWLRVRWSARRSWRSAWPACTFRGASPTTRRRY